MPVRAGSLPAGGFLVYSLAMHLSFVLLAGCRVVTAPDNLQELAVFGFVNYSDAPAAEATGEAYPPLVDSNLDALNGGLYVDALETDHLAAVGIDSDAVDIVGAMGSVEYRHSVADVLRLLTALDKTEFDANTVRYEVLDTGDRECFLAGECERLDQLVTETTDVPLLGEATRTYDISWRWVDHPDGPMVLSRTLNPGGISFNSSIMNVFQQYAMICFYDVDGHARRVEAFWVDAEFIGIDVPKSFAVDTAVDEMSSAAEDIDDALDAGW